MSVESPPRLSIREVDFHSHILPRLDDGSTGTDMSLAQLKLAAGAGVRVVCLTPHFYPHRTTVEDFLSRRAASLEALRAVLPPDAPGLLPGAEVLVTEGIFNIEGIEKLCLSGTNYLLFEMPFKEWTRGLVESALELCDLPQITPIMAHADRYDPEGVAIFLEAGVRLQLNIDGFTRLSKHRRLKRWVNDGVVAAFGSDIHRSENPYQKWHKISDMPSLFSSR